MHEVWRISIGAGAGAAIGVAAAGLLARSSRAPLLAALVGIVVAGVLAWVVFDWKAAVAAAVGGALGGFGAGTFARGALTRGGTAGGTATLLVAAAVALFALALVPVVGFVEAVVIPILAARTRRRAGEKYAGLRTLAK
jgi:hypothetical protein